jgi:hypothetical protein
MNDLTPFGSLQVRLDSVCVRSVECLEVIRSPWACESRLLNELIRIAVLSFSLVVINVFGSNCLTVNGSSV